MGNISYRELKVWFIENEEAKQLAKDVFGDKQPSILETDSYHPSGANWSYRIGLVQVKRTETNKIFEDAVYEVVTQFGVVKAARRVHLPEMK